MRAVTDPAVDAELDALEARQRAEAPRPQAVFERETRRVRIPPGGELPRSAALLERFHGGAAEFTVREKKPMVVDTRRSWGPYMVSVDERPLALLDACSQIATQTHGFYHPEIVKALHTGRFDPCLWSNPDTAQGDVPELAAYAEALRGLAPPALAHVAFVGAGGAEANEKALRIARLHAPPPVAGRRRTRVLAFRDGFHGRTLVALMATWNPDKRAAFEFTGYEAVFAAADLGDVERLLAAHAGELYAILVEPMQAEGGDVYLRRELLLGLCRLARAHRLPLVVDEVQTGFFTGGTFLWWQRLGLGGDEASTPDIITLAKKAGLGVVMSRWPDPERNQVSVASALRGLLQLEAARDQAPLAALLRPRAEALAAAFPELVHDLRLAGTALAFDLPDPAAQAAFIAQRTMRGLMTYPAGARTIRFRFSASWDERALDDLFARIAEALCRLSDRTATEFRPEGQEGVDPGVLVRPVEERDWPQIMAIEDAAYEPARRDSEAYLRAAALAGLGLCAVDVATGAILGFCFGGPLEHFRGVVGPDRDDRHGLGDTFFSADVTVAGPARARGVGRLLKRAQVHWAKVHGFSYISGRNRVGKADAMLALNRAHGAFPVARLEREHDGDAFVDQYYRIPLVPPPPPRPAAGEGPLDLASGLQRPFGPAPDFMARRELVGPTASRVNLSQYATLDTVHYTEHLRLLAPRGTAHMYFTSSRDETVDKALRCLRLSRPAGQLAVGLQGGYLGHVTAAARSLSDPRGLGEGLALFEFPRLPHPAAGIAAFSAALDDLVQREGSGRLLGVFAEVVGERSGHVLEGSSARALADACRRHDLPLVLVETASGCYRGGGGPWGVDTLPPDVVPDMVLWYPGGQIGHVFVGDRHFVGKPLVLISTWDGDELSAIRAHEHLRAARRLPLREATLTLDALVQEARALRPDLRAGGLGLYRTLTFAAPHLADAALQTCTRHGLRPGRGLPDTLILAPPLDIPPRTIAGELRRRLCAALREAPQSP